MVKIRSIAMLVTLALIAACGGGGGTTTSAGGVTDTTAAASDTTEGGVSDTTAAAGDTTTAGGTEGGGVTVLVVWGGAELESFEAMLAPFEESTGIDVQVESTRDLNAVLTTRLAGGNPPDVAGLPGPGPMADFFRDGDLV
ncbi:MAG: hypothetical protein ABR609_11675, partial [Acidimicrobiia bacterium]